MISGLPVQDHHHFLVVFRILITNNLYSLDYQFKYNITSSNITSEETDGKSDSCFVVIAIAFLACAFLIITKLSIT